MFPKYDVYTTVQSIYYYPDTDEDIAFCGVLAQCIETEDE